MMGFINKLAISSLDIEALQRMRDEYVDKGCNAVIALHIEGLLEGAAELTVTMHDQDAPIPHGLTY